MARRNETEDRVIVEKLDLDLGHLIWLIMKIFIASIPALILAILVYVMLFNVLSSLG